MITFGKMLIKNDTKEKIPYLKENVKLNPKNIGITYINVYFDPPVDEDGNPKLIGGCYGICKDLLAKNETVYFTQKDDGTWCANLNLILKGVKDLLNKDVNIKAICRYIEKEDSLEIITTDSSSIVDCYLLTVEDFFLND